MPTHKPLCRGLFKKEGETTRSSRTGVISDVQYRETQIEAVGVAEGVAVPQLH